MSTSRGSNNGGANIPAGARRMVQSLKEIVNCSEAEIYATLKDCNMDPNEAVNRLLSQDPFHEVKSKREKKKEIKDTSEPRSRGNNSSSRGIKSGADRYSGRGSTAYSLPEYGRPSYKKENGPTSYTSSSSSAYGAAGSSMNKRPSVSSDVASTENQVPSIGTTEEFSSGPQPSMGFQPAWVGVPGQRSMADIVKMGRPHKPSGITSDNVSNYQTPSSEVHGSSRYSEDQPSKVSGANVEPGVPPAQQIPTNDEWPSIDKTSSVSLYSGPDPPAYQEMHPDASKSFDGIKRHPETEEVQEAEEDAIEDLGGNQVGSATISSANAPEENSGGSSSLFENELYNNMGSFQHHDRDYEHEEARDIGVSASSVAGNLEQLVIRADDRGLSPEREPSVVIPDHLQVQTTECSHLSFGSFVSRVGAVPLLALHPRTNREDTHKKVDMSSVGQSDTRNPEYFGDESHRNTSDDLFHRTGPNVGNYDASSASQPEDLKQENTEVAHGNQYNFSASTPDYSFDNAQQLNAALNQSQTNSQMQNLAPFSSVMQAYTNSLPSTLLAANVHPGREPDLQYSPFPMTQSMPAKYGNSASAIGGSAISMPEALKTTAFPSSQHTQQTLSGTSVATGPPLPQQLAVHPYSQPALPLGPFANMISYPFLPHNYTYMPSAFPQTFAGNSTYHQSLAAMVPQYKNSVSVSSLPQSAAVASGYGAFGSSSTIPGNFPLNPTAAPSGTNLNYDDVLSSQYKDSNHLISLQQNENSGVWLHGPNSRTMPAVTTGTFYNYQGQNQQSGSFRQGHQQQPSQSYGALGYPNFYHGQAGISLDQQPNPRDGSLGGSQGQPKQSQQIWPNNY